MISIITAIHNQLAMNKLFWENLCRYTHNQFELIIIDNASTDGSAEFFISVGAKVIRNKYNYSYPHSQNQGMAAAQFDTMMFLNNDIIVSPQWDQHLLDTMEKNGLEVAAACGIEQVENFQATRRFKKRWRRIKNTIGLLFGRTKRSLSLMHKLMYPQWEEFSRKRYKEFSDTIKEGFVGNTVVIKRSALAKIGLWDERLQQGDFDLYLRTKFRAVEYGDIKPMHICLGVFIHHYIRLTEKAGYPPFADASNFIELEDKWSEKELRYLELLNK